MTKPKPRCKECGIRPAWIKGVCRKCIIQKIERIKNEAQETTTQKNQTTDYKNKQDESVHDK